MRKPLSARFVITLLLCCLPGLAEGQTVEAQSPPSRVRPTSGADRLFLAFIEDATVIDGQWWEGQFEFSDGDRVDTSLLRGVVALQPWKKLEVGGRVGFGSTDIAGSPDGSGATDLDVWGKYYLGHLSDHAEFAVGGVATVPTGDENAGLGFDAFSISGFGTMRYKMTSAIISAHLGIRITGDGQTFRGSPGSAVELEGETSPMAGVGVIVPFSDRVSLVGEARIEGDRFEGSETDFRVLGGLNWRSFNRGMLRGAVAVGLSDGAPDAQFFIGYATQL